MQASELERAMNAYRGLLRTSRKLRRLVRPIFVACGISPAHNLRRSLVSPGEGISLTELAEVSSADPATSRLGRCGAARQRRPGHPRALDIRPAGRRHHIDGAGPGRPECHNPLARGGCLPSIRENGARTVTRECEILDEVECLIDAADATSGAAEAGD